MAGYKRLMHELRDTLLTTPGRARPVLHEILGDAVIHEEDDQIFGQFESPTQRLLNAATNTEKFGCMSPQPNKKPCNRKIAGLCCF